MTANRRILLNVAATYGRSLYALVLGLFVGRWALMALGKVDYGLVGVVGGLTAFVAFANNLLASAVGRFYAVNVGAAKKIGNEIEGLEECRRWFNTALLVHVCIPLILVVIGYPVGEWAVRNFLEIPPDRVESCVWVWRFTCLACFVGMANVPFQAMYTAKQEIAELTVYSVAAATVNAFFLYYMVSNPGFWLVKFSAWKCFISAAPQLLITIGAVVKYKECRFRAGYLLSMVRIKQILHYAFARFWTALSDIFANQGNVVLVNKYLGPAINASQTVGTTVSGQAASLSAALSGAFWPAIANTAGEGNVEKVRRLSFMTCRMGALLLLVFAIPLMVEIDKVLILWLKNPPDRLSMICIAVLLVKILERMSEGYWMAIMAFGNGIARYSWYVGWAGFSGFFIAWILLALGFGVPGLCASMVLAQFAVIGVRLTLGRSLAGLSVRYWLLRVFLPLVLVSLVTVGVGFLPRLFMSESFLRICVTTIICEIVFIPAIWFLILEREERSYIVARLPVLKKYVKEER